MNLPKIFSLSFLGLITASSLMASAEQELEVQPGLVKKVKLPFEYGSLPKDRSLVKIVIERFYTVLQDEKIEDSTATLTDSIAELKPATEEEVIRVAGATVAFVGPLQPCILVALRNNETGRAIVFHKHFSNKLDSLLSTASEVLAIDDPAHLSGVLFTNKMSEINYKMSGMQKLHNNLSQRDEVLRVKNALVETFKLTDRTQIKAQLYQTSLPDWALGDYETAELGVVVNSKLEVKSLCSMHEDVYSLGPELGKLPLLRRYKLVTAQAAQYANSTGLSKFGHMKPGDDIIYNTMPFYKVD